MLKKLSFILISRILTSNSYFFVSNLGKLRLHICRGISSALQDQNCHKKAKYYNSQYNLTCRQYCNSKSVVEMPPIGIKGDWSLKLTPEELLTKTSNLINICKNLYDLVENVPNDDVSYETVLKVLNNAEREIGSQRFLLDSSQHISTDEAIRTASTEADRKLREFFVEVRMKKGVFEKLLVLKEKKVPLKPEAERYLDKLILMGKRNGLHLDENTQKRIKELSTKMSSLCIDFLKNINDVTTTLEFSDQELDGLPADFLKSLKRNPDTGKAEVTLKYPHYIPIVERCKVPETRRKLEYAFNTQCVEENGRILTELRKLRHEHATLLGYPSHAEYTTQVLMSKSAETVQKFLKDLAVKLAPLHMEERKYLLELKEKECTQLGLPFDGKLNSWDTTYYATQAKEIKYSIDTNKLKEYFPMPVVKNGLLEIYQDLLGLKFEQVTGDVWHEDVELYSVKDANSGTLLGYFFLDLFPRPNKYSHAAMFGLQNSYLLPDGTRQVAVGAMVANFTKPTEEKPALLDHDEVTTFFHEFGHVMHHICMEMEFPHFDISNVERDFIEAPSQMLENWCWEKAPLKKMSSHYLTKSEIPEAMLNALMKSRLSNVGSKNLRQIILATYDQRIHTNPEGDTRELYYELMREIVGIEPQEGTHMPCHFGHIVNEYDAQYYGYLWSEVYSMDMFQTRFSGENILNPAIGKDYREKILRPGATRDALDLVTDFLGRAPAPDAFLLSKGLKL